MFPYTGYARMSVRLVQTSLGMKIKPTSDMGSLFSVSSTASLPGSTSTATQTPTGPRHVLVYYLGGVSLAQRDADRLRLSIATTAICHGNRLLRAV
jgi:vacuolar protein sorting-associated protein 33A